MSESGGFVVTHVAPPEGLQAWREPDPAGAVVAQLQAGTQLQLLERLGAWAKVAFSNGWAAWVDGRRIVDATPAAAPPQAASPRVSQPPQPQPQAGEPRPEPGRQQSPWEPQARQPAEVPKLQAQAAPPQGQRQPQPVQPADTSGQAPAPLAGQPQIKATRSQTQAQPSDPQPQDGGDPAPSLEKGPARSKQQRKQKSRPEQAGPARPPENEPPVAPQPVRIPSPAPAPEPTPEPVRGRLAALPAIASIRLSPSLIGAAVLLLGTILSWIRVSGTKSNAYDVPIAFLWNYKSGSDGGIKVGLLLLALTIFVAVFAIFPGRVLARRILGGATVAIALIYTIQLQRALSAAGDGAPSLLSAIGFGVMITVGAGVAVVLDKSEAGP